MIVCKIYKISFNSRLYIRPVLYKSMSSSTTCDNGYTYPIPCRVGDEISSVDTPALFVREHTLNENITLMRDIMKRKYTNISLRPHMKAHKCPEIANMQADGCSGICCQTLTETEAFLFDKSSNHDILLSNQIIGEKKITRLCKLLDITSSLSLCVDSADNVKMIDSIMKQTQPNKILDLVVEVDVGQKRCGVRPGPEVAELAKLIKSLSNVRFKGIQCYQGINQHIRMQEDKKIAVDLVVDLAKQSLLALSNEGIECNYITGGGTGTFHYEASSGVFTEVQPGSYIFMDADYNRNMALDSVTFDDEFKQSLFVLTTVQSITKGSHATVDAGMKAISMDSGDPLVKDRSDLIYKCGGDEHGILNTDANLKVNDLLELIPGHCDPTINLYDWLIFVNNDNKVTKIAKISGRGPGV